MPQRLTRTKDVISAQACKDLVTLLQGGRQGWPLKKTSGPLIILAFDEAQTLMDLKDTYSTQWSHFNELQHALHALHRSSCSLSSYRRQGRSLSLPWLQPKMPRYKFVPENWSRLSRLWMLGLTPWHTGCLLIMVGIWKI